MRLQRPDWIQVQEVVFEKAGDEITGLVVGKLFRMTRYGEIPVFFLYKEEENQLIMVQAWAKMLKDYLLGGSGRTAIRLGERITITYHGRREKRKPPGTFYHVFRRSRSHYISSKYTYPQK